MVFRSHNHLGSAPRLLIYLYLCRYCMSQETFPQDFSDPFNQENSKVGQKEKALIYFNYSINITLSKQKIVHGNQKAIYRKQ